MARTILALVLCFGWVHAGFGIEVRGIRYWNAPDHVRLVLDVSEKAAPKVFGLENPRRLVLDFPGGKLAAPLPRFSERTPFIRRVRSGRPQKNVLRVVLDLKTAVEPKIFTLPPNERYGHRLVLDLYRAGGPVAAERRRGNPSRSRLPAPSRLRKVTIAIDAGHGGEDPGAIGRRGTREKDVVLAIAKKLARLIDDTPGMQAVLIRKGDYYIPLRRRIQLAREARADLFVSIHADAFRDPKASGSGVYILSERGASSEAARWLAARENASDLVGGVSLDDKDEVLAKVLLDLSLTGTRQYSQRLAREVLEELRRIGRIHHEGVQQAGFVVLKSPDIPSVLIETAFISNPVEEKRLRSERHQWFWARAIHRGIRDYFKNHAPPGTLLAAERRHVIARGETLSEIAEIYGVSVKRLMDYNDLDRTQVRAGQILKIPVGG